MQSLLLKLIYTISKDTSQKNKSGAYAGKYSVIEKSIIYIQNHLTENLSSEAVSAAMSLSPIHFHNTFKVSVGKTLHDYIEDLQKKAINLLITTDYSLTKLLLNAGFLPKAISAMCFNAV